MPFSALDRMLRNAGAASGGAAAAQDAAPYLYYEYGGGHLIERADGADAHLVPGVDGLPFAKDNAAWSPSGEWLAWRAYGRESCGAAAGASAEYLVIASPNGAVAFGYDWVQFAWSKGASLHP